MPDSTYLHIHVLPQHEKEFHKLHLINTRQPSQRFPGMIEIQCDEFDPQSLGSLHGLPFFGMHGGYPGVYGPHVVCHAGDGPIYTCPCLDNGQVAAMVVDPWEDGDATAPRSVLNYLAMAGYVVQSMREQLNPGEDVES